MNLTLFYSNLSFLVVCDNFERGIIKELFTPVELEKKYSVNILIAFILLIFITGLLYFINLVYHPISTIPQISKYVDPSFMPLVNPEPVEKLQFMLSLIFLPFIIIGLHFLFKKVNLEQVHIYNVLFIISSFLVLLCLFIGLNNVKYFYVSKYILYEHPILGTLSSVILVFIYLYARKHSIQKPLSILVIIASVYVSLYVAFLNVFFVQSIDNTVSYEVHFNAVYYSMAAIMYKNSLFVNLENQYGLYPELLRPLFKLTGLSVHKFTFVMCSLIAVTFLSWFFMLYKTVENKWIAFIGFLATIFFGYVFIHRQYGDSYLQYYPIRTIFPSLLFIISTLYLKSKMNIFYYIGWTIFPIGILWNVETGVVTFITWMAFLLYNEFAKIDETLIKRLLKQIFMGLIFTVSILVLYSLYILLKSGHIPNYLGMVDYIKFFYSYGINMIPMPIIHPWNLIIFVYIIGLVISITSILNGKYEMQNHMIFLISILGCGLFSYYQGRSHDVVLCYAWYPAFLLICIYTDKLIRSKLKLHIITSYIMLFLLTASALSAVILIPSDGKLYGGRLKQGSSKEYTSVMKQIDFIKRYKKTGDSTTILSLNSGVYYGETKTTPELNLPGSSEMLLKKEYDELQSQISYQTLQSIFLDSNYDSLYQTNKDIVRVVKQYYTPVNASEDEQMVLYHRK